MSSSGEKFNSFAQLLGEFQDSEKATASLSSERGLWCQRGLGSNPDASLSWLHPSVSLSFPSGQAEVTIHPSKDREVVSPWRSRGLQCSSSSSLPTLSASGRCPSLLAGCVVAQAFSLAVTSVILSLHRAFITALLTIPQIRQGGPCVPASR